MAQNYTRQSSFADGDTITASLFNNEYNQLVNAFTYSSTDVDATGHRHDGTSGEGGNIYRIGDLNFLNKIEADSVNNRWGFFVEVSSTAVEQIRIQDGVILPVITNDIDLGSATFQFKDLYLDGTANIDSLVLSSGSTVTAILDEDSLVSDSSTALATQQSIKAYVDAQVTAQDLDFQGDTGGALSIDLDSETLTIAGGTGIDTAGATNTLTVSIDSTVATLTGTQTLTNKTIDADNNTVSNLEVDNLKSGVLDTDISSVAGTHTTLPSALAVKTYVDAQVTAQDLDIFGDTGTDAIDLDSETLTFTGGTGITSVVTAGTVTHNIDSTVATLTGTQTLTNKTLTSPDINGGTVDGAVIGGTTAAAGSFTNITVSGTVDGRDVAADGTKLDGIEALADVTDTTNVTAAGALMDSELTNITAVKALNQGVATTDSPSFAGLTATTADINGGTIDGTVIGGTTAAAGSFTTGQFGTSLNVDGTVTADGLTVDGNSVFTTADNSAQVTLISTDTDALVGPQLNLWRNSGAGTNGDLIGQITFTGEDTVGSTNTFASIYSVADQTNNGSEDGSIHFQTLINGVLADRFEINSAGNSVFTGTVTADGLTVDGNGLLYSASNVEMRGDANVRISLGTAGTSGANNNSNWIYGNGTNLRFNNAGGFYSWETLGTERMRIDASGNVGIGASSVGAKLHVLSGTDNNIAAGVSEVRFIGADKAITGEQANLVIQTNDDMAVNKGGSIGLGGRHTTSSTNGVNFAQISGRKENATSANFAGYLAFGTSDSASDIHERMRIDSSGNVGIGLSGAIPSARLQVRTGTNLNLAVQTGTTDTSGMKINAFNDAANTNIPLEINGSVLLLKTGETERARIDSSGNVGIGTGVDGISTNGLKTVIKGSTGYPATSGTTQTGVLRLSGGTGLYNVLDMGVNESTDTAWMQATRANNLGTYDNLVINPYGGSVGIGTSSPNSYAGQTTLTINSTGVARLDLDINDAYQGYLLAEAGYIGLYAQSGNYISMGVAGVGEAMRINASGDVGIGATGALTSTYLSKAFVYTAGGANFAIGGSSNTNDAVLSRFTSFNISNSNSGNQDSANFFGVTSIESIVVTTDSNAGDDSGGSLLFKTKPEAGALQESMRLDSSGNLGLGVTPSAWSAPAFQISRGSHFADTGSVGMQHNAYFNSGWKYIASSQGALQFQAIPGTGFLWNTAPSGTAGNAISFSEAMRIDSSGNLLVGRSSAGAAATDNGHVFYGSGQHYIFSNATECVRFYETSGSGQQVGSISITSSATAFNTSSDERLKENITDAPAGNVDDIKVRSFDWKADGSHQDYGMVAQELEAVAPYAVTKGETEDDMWSVDYSKLVPMLIKEIQDLKAEVAALKGAN
jgi:hypothetical protein